MKQKKQLLKYLDTLQKELSHADLEGSFTQIRTAIDALKEKSSGASESTSFEVLPLVKNNPNAVAIYSDGACRGNPGPGAWGAIAQDHESKILFELSQVDEYTTNNRMELSGALEGMRYMVDYLQQRSLTSRNVQLHVVTDSKYLVDGMNSWVDGWKKRGWKKADKKVPENVELWQSLDELKSQFLKVQFHWVKGHAGHPQNEYCDKLANEALDNEGH